MATDFVATECTQRVFTIPAIINFLHQKNDDGKISKTWIKFNETMRDN